MLNVVVSNADAVFLTKDLAERAKRVKDPAKKRQMERIARAAGNAAMVPVKTKAGKRAHRSAKQRTGATKPVKRRALRK